MFPFQSRSPRYNENVSFRMARFGHPPPEAPGPGWMMPQPSRPFRQQHFPPNNNQHRPNYRFDMSSTSLKNTCSNQYFNHHQPNQMYNCQYQDHCSITVTYSSSYAANASLGVPNPIDNEMYNLNSNNIQDRPQRQNFSTTRHTKKTIKSFEQIPECAEHKSKFSPKRLTGSKKSSEINECLKSNKLKDPQASDINKVLNPLHNITFGSFEDIAFETGKGVGPEMPGDHPNSKIKRNCIQQNIKTATKTNCYQDSISFSSKCLSETATQVSNDTRNKKLNLINYSEGNNATFDKDLESQLGTITINDDIRDEEDCDVDQTEDEGKHVELNKGLTANGSIAHNDIEEETDRNTKENDNELSSQSETETDNNLEEPEEQRKFTKSYWRKQRRIRLKERLLAQKALMESDPDYIPEQRESSKDPKNTKSKAIDYDLYLPAHVLMHVKRDLVSVLMEYGQTREVKVTFEDMERSGPHHASRFHTAAVVDNETFPVGSGSSKKMAKKAAAAHALKIMYDRGKSNLDGVNETANLQVNRLREEEIGTHAHKILLVSRHVLQTVEETQFINYSKDKICATFVLEHNNKMRVVGLGTGNRCILYQHMTKDGQRVLHSHAEIMARRAFMRFLYTQLIGYQPNRNHPLFTCSETGKLKLRDKFQVHLYISRPPCGDAAAFPTISNFPNKMRAIRKQGQLRTIIDDGEGAIPTDFEVPAGPNGKERLRIMTCSDKICRWNVLGVQGALLSHYIDPIYLNSLVIGSHTGDQQGHVPRAVSGRLKCGRLHEVIQRPYRINSPEIHYPIDELSDQYNITKSKQYCITWALGDHDAEILDAITGVANMEPMDNPVPSRVAKTSLFDLFKQVSNKFGRSDLATLDYTRAKKSAATFQRMKSFVGQHLAAMGFGQWYSLHQTYGTDSFPCPKQC